MNNDLKTFTAGTHRVAHPDETLLRALPFARQMGITRLAVLTGLDVLGIPTVAAVRPNSRSVAQHQGKGLTLAAAKASALMEAVEAFHAESFTGPLRLASVDEMTAIGATTDTSKLAGRSTPVTRRILWAEGRDLIADCTLWAPYELITTDYTEQCTELQFHGTSNGLASGNTLLEALLHGLYEVIERDSNALFHRMSEPAQDARAVNLDSITGPCVTLIDAFRRAGVLVRVWNQTSDIGLPVFRCMSAPGDSSDIVEPDSGYGCHSDRDIALSRALTEVAQSRLTRIAGARDDIDPATFSERAKLAARENAIRCMSETARQNFELVPTRTTDRLQDDLDHILSCLIAVGCNQVFCLDMTRPEFAIPVVRVIVPGLEGVWTRHGDGYIPGRRAAATSA